MEGSSRSPFISSSLNLLYKECYVKGHYSVTTRDARGNFQLRIFHKFHFLNSVPFSLIFSEINNLHYKP